MSAEHQGPAGKPDGKSVPGADSHSKAQRGGSSLTDAVVAALAKVEDKTAKPEPARVEQEPPVSGEAEPMAATAKPEPAPVIPAEAGCAATSQPAADEPEPTNHHGPNGFRSGPGSFVELAQRQAGAAPVIVAAAPTPVAEPATENTSSADADERSDAGPAAAEPALVSEPQAPAEVGPIDVTYYGRTDVGLVREHNEDNFLVADLTAGQRGVDAPHKIEIGERGCIFAVCDGMGGAAAGEVASQMAVDTIFEVFESASAPKDRDAFARRLVTAIEEAGHRIFSAAKMDRTRRGMGTTTTLAGLVDNILFVGQVGDSRAYILRNQQLELITKDQSLVNQLIEAGQLTEEEAEAFEHSNIILQALGTTEEVTVDLTFLDLRPGDRLLLCSDGLSGLVHADMIKEAMQSSPDLAEVAGKLIQMANAGGGHDNITVILADFAGAGLTAPVEARALYQQYPLPPDDSAPERGAPREPSMKAGAPKPGADVKHQDPAVSAEVALPTSGGKTGLLLLGLGLLVVLAVVAWFAIGPSLTGESPGANADDPAPSASAEELPPPPPAPAAPEPPPDEPPVAAPETGTVRVTTDVEPGATLFVNDEARGPLTDGMTLDLAPGAYVLEARSGDAQIVEQTVTVTAGQEASVTLSVPALPPEPVVEEAPPASQQQERPRRRPPRERPEPAGGVEDNGLPSNPF